MSKSPFFVSPDMIGKVVSVQIIEREMPDSDTLKSGPYEKYVGVLQAYSIDKDEALSFRIEGMERWRIYNPSTFYVEIIERESYSRPTKPLDGAIPDDILLSTRADAEEVLTRLSEMAQMYGCATVADMYEMVGITGRFVDNKHGWRSLNGARISSIQEGYMLILPPPVPLD